MHLLVCISLAQNALRPDTNVCAGYPVFLHLMDAVLAQLELSGETELRNEKNASIILTCWQISLWGYYLDSCLKWKRSSYNERYHSWEGGLGATF